MNSDEESYEEDEDIDMELSESSDTKETCPSSENELSEKSIKYGTLNEVFFQILPPAHANSCPKVLVYLPLNTPVYFKGKLKIIRVISGAIECLGSTLTNKSITGFGQNIFSPKGYSLLSLLAVTNLGHQDNDDQKKKDRKFLKNELKQAGVKKEMYQKIFDQDEAQGCFFEIGNLDGPGWAKVLDKYISHSLSNKSTSTSRLHHSKPMSLFRRDYSIYSQQHGQEQSVQDKVEQLLDVTLYDSYSYLCGPKVPRLFQSTPDWEIAVNNVMKSMNSSENKMTRLVVGGGKGVGKSTFMRYVTNRLIELINRNSNSSIIPSVLYIDLDPGQAEFTIPGCLSVTKVTRPVIGPNFCHLEHIKEYCEYFGEINVSNMPRGYDGCVRRILGYCEENKELKNMPWLINTMGFTSGLGAKMMSTVLTLSQPSVLVELRSRFAKKNYKANLKSYLNQTCKSPCEYLQFNAIPESISAKDMRAKDLWGIPEPKKLRDISILAYFGQCAGSGNEKINHNLLRAVTPYSVSWDDVAVQVLHATISSCSIPKLFNMSLVGLGQILKENKNKSLEKDDDDKVEKNENPSKSNASLNPNAPVFIPVAATGMQPLAEQNIFSESQKSRDGAKEQKNKYLRPPKLLSQKEICRNIGFGFVRGVDTEKRIFYVVTPIGLEEMQLVNCLSMGAVTLPTGIIGNQTEQYNQEQSRKNSNVSSQSSIKDEKYKKKHAPYIARLSTLRNQGSCSTPFSEPWQRYSKPKFQESQEHADLLS